MNTLLVLSIVAILLFILSNTLLVFRKYLKKILNKNMVPSGVTVEILNETVIPNNFSPGDIAILGMPEPEKIDYEKALELINTALFCCKEYEAGPDNVPELESVLKFVMNQQYLLGVMTTKYNNTVNKYSDLVDKYVDLADSFGQPNNIDDNEVSEG